MKHTDIGEEAAELTAGDICPECQQAVVDPTCGICSGTGRVPKPNLVPPPPDPTQPSPSGPPHGDNGQ